MRIDKKTKIKSDKPENKKGISFSHQQMYSLLHVLITGTSPPLHYIYLEDVCVQELTSSRAMLVAA